MARGIGGEGGAAGGRDPMGGVGSRGFSGYGGGGNGGGFGAYGSPSSPLYKPLPTAVPRQRPVAPDPGQNLMQSFVPAATLGGPIPGLKDYMLNLPSYGYFGAPGQMRPGPMGQSAILSPMMRGGFRR